MFKEIIEKQRIVFKDSIDNWEEAISIAAQPLLREGVIVESYIHAMIDCVKEFGPYIVIAPNIAIPHAHSGCGVRKTAISFMKVENPVHFSESPEHDARLFFVLASTGNDSHMPLIMSIVSSLSDENIINKLLESKSIEDIEHISKEIEKTM